MGAVVLCIMLSFHGYRKIKNNEHDYREKYNKFFMLNNQPLHARRVNGSQWNTIASMFNTEPIYTCDRCILKIYLGDSYQDGVNVYL